MGVDPIKLVELKKEIPFKFKPQSVKFGRAVIVTYIDARDVQDTLDDVCGPENWQNEYTTIDGNLYCKIGINVQGTGWVYKSDCGTESNMEKEKGQSSDAFKRAAVQWGVGRFLYRQKMIELKTADYKGKEKPCTDDGKILWNNDEITAYIRKHKLNVTNKTSSSAVSSPKSSKYQKTDGKPEYTKHSWSQDTINKIKGLKKDGKEGKECLKHFLPVFCKAKKVEYKELSELNDDKKMGELIKFIEESKPQAI